MLQKLTSIFKPLELSYGDFNGEFSITKLKSANLNNRSDSKNRKANDVNIEDIIKAVADLDVQNILPVFVANDLSKLPDLQPEELNKLYYINKVASLEAQIK